MNIAIYAIAAGFARMGFYALLWLAKIGRFFDVRIESVDGRNETRAVYGGFGIAIAAVLLLAMQSPRLHEGIITCVGFALAGMAGGRVLSAVVERPGAWPWVFGVIEAVAAVILFYSVPAATP